MLLKEFDFYCRFLTSINGLEKSMKYKVGRMKAIADEKFRST